MVLSPPPQQWRQNSELSLYFTTEPHSQFQSSSFKRLDSIPLYNTPLFLYPFFCSGHIGLFCILTVVKDVIMNTRGQVFLFSIYIYSFCLCRGTRLLLNLWRSEDTVGDIHLLYTMYVGLGAQTQVVGPASKLLHLLSHLAGRGMAFFTIQIPFPLGI